VGRLVGQVLTDATVAVPRTQALPGCWSGDDSGEVRPGHVSGALVRVLDATPEPPPAAPLVLEERGCRFAPPVAGLVEGQGLLVRGADRERHAWTVRRAGEVLFRVVQPAGAPAPAHPVPPGAEVLEVSCDEHPTARAHVFSRPNGQFTTTDAQGRFELRGLRPGFRTVEAWHPLLKPLRRTVEVTAGGEDTQDFRMAPRR
jgi:hypothetical protein